MYRNVKLDVRNVETRYCSNLEPIEISFYEVIIGILFLDFIRISGLSVNFSHRAIRRFEIWYGGKELRRRYRVVGISQATVACFS